MDPVLSLLGPKLIQFSEAVVCFFERCNLNCVFCPQDHRSVVGMSREEILSKAALLDRFIATQDSSDIHLHLMGGELFQDELIEQGFLEIYSEFIERIRSKTSAKKNLVFNFVTNLTLNNLKPLREFCLLHDLKLSVSYDPSGRFNASERVVFESNIDQMADRIRMVSCVITRPNIERIKAGDPLFERLYSEFPIDWDPLIPALENSPQLMPRESELLEFYRLLVDRYPECINLEGFVSAAPHQRMRCTRGKSLTIMPNNLVPGGCSGALLLKEAKTPDLQGSNIIEKFLKKYDCLSCPFYSRCQFTCFIK